jgi:hypothetical protein
MSLNRALLLGRLTADPFIASSLPPRCTFSLAVPGGSAWADPCGAPLRRRVEQRTGGAYGGPPVPAL